MLQQLSLSTLAVLCLVHSTAAVEERINQHVSAGYQRSKVKLEEIVHSAPASPNSRRRPAPVLTHISAPDQLTQAQKAHLHAALADTAISRRSPTLITYTLPSSPKLPASSSSMEYLPDSPPRHFSRPNTAPTSSPRFAPVSTLSLSSESPNFAPVSSLSTELSSDAESKEELQSTMKPVIMSDDKWDWNRSGRETVKKEGQSKEVGSKATRTTSKPRQRRTKDLQAIYGSSSSEENRHFPPIPTSRRDQKEQEERVAAREQTLSDLFQKGVPRRKVSKSNRRGRISRSPYVTTAYGVDVGKVRPSRSMRIERLRKQKQSERVKI